VNFSINPELLESNLASPAFELLIQLSGFDKMGFDENKPNDFSTSLGYRANVLILHPLAFFAKRSAIGNH
jgi:hypothetical protein